MVCMAGTLQTMIGKVLFMHQQKKAYTKRSILGVHILISVQQNDDLLKLKNTKLSTQPYLKYTNSTWFLAELDSKHFFFLVGEKLSVHD